MDTSVTAQYWIAPIFSIFGTEAALSCAVTNRLRALGTQTVASFARFLRAAHGYCCQIRELIVNIPYRSRPA